MDKKRPYEPRIFEGRVMLPEEQEQIYMQLLTSKRMESVTDSMRELILEEWPELAHKPAAETTTGVAAPGGRRCWRAVTHIAGLP